MNDPLLAGLRQHFGFAEFRPLQREAIEHLQGGGDALVLMPTGGGKSLCYQLPALLSGGLTLVVSPLIALMQDQVRALRSNGAAADVLNSSLTPQEAFQVEARVRRGQTRLLYAAPERLAAEAFRQLLNAAPPTLIAIDEAHCISQWGHQFRPDYRQLAQLTNRFAEVPVAALTATATARVAADIVQQLGRPAMRTFRSGYNRPNLVYRVVPKKDSTERLVRLLQRDPEAAAIVYSLRRADTETTAERLQAAGIAALAYHAGLSSSERTAAQERFDRGEVPVICATVAFGMGVDKPDVRRVIHLDMPESIETYYQETGRAGRDGDPAECLLFYTPGVWYQRKYFLDQIENQQEREQAFQRLRQMMNYCELKTCRRGVLLSYFGDSAPSGGCGGCDNCLRDGDPTEPQAADERHLPAEPERATAAAPGRTEEPLSEAEQALFEQLRELRRELAQQEQQPAYIIASDRSLRALVRARPRSPQELLEVHGFGPAKVERYGGQLLAAIGEMQPPPGEAGQLTLTPQRPPPAPAAEPEADGEALDSLESWEITLRLWREGCSALAIAERRMLSPQTVLTHLASAIRSSEQIDLRPELPGGQRLAKIRTALEDSADLSAAHELLDARFSRYELRVVQLYLDAQAGGGG